MKIGPRQRSQYCIDQAPLSKEHGNINLACTPNLCKKFDIGHELN